MTIEFRSDEAEKQMVSRLKDGSSKLGERKWTSFVHVQGQNHFIDCLNWKYDDTKSRWKAFDDLDAEIGD